eukprot:SAG22_NODE_3584_length_1632_cov_1.357469_1_plen_277_part_10
MPEGRCRPGQRHAPPAGLRVVAAADHPADLTRAVGLHAGDGVAVQRRVDLPLGPDPEPAAARRRAGHRHRHSPVPAPARGLAVVEADGELKGRQTARKGTVLDAILVEAQQKDRASLLTSVRSGPAPVWQTTPPSATPDPNATATTSPHDTGCGTAAGPAGTAAGAAAAAATAAAGAAASSTAAIEPRVTRPAVLGSSVAMPPLLLLLLAVAAAPASAAAEAPVSPTSWAAALSAAPSSSSSSAAAAAVIFARLAAAANEMARGCTELSKSYLETSS